MTGRGRGGARDDAEGSVRDGAEGPFEDGAKDAEDVVRGDDDARGGRRGDARGGLARGEGPPPFGGSWRALYTAVLLNLLLMVVLFYLFTRAFS